MAKYYGTLIGMSYERYNKLKELGYKGFHNQFRIVCKAKSLAEANRIAESYGLGKNCFKKNWTSITGNTKEIKLADENILIVCIDGTSGNEYTGINNV